MQTLGTAAATILAPKPSPASRPNVPALPAARDADGLPVAVDRTCDIALPRELFWAWIPRHGPRVIVRALQAAERALLTGRAQALSAALAPFAADQAADIEAQIAAMLSGFRAMRQSGDDALATIAITRQVLRDFPAWAITRGCMTIARGEAGLDRRYAPNDTEIHAVVSEIVRLRRDALRNAQALLDAPIENVEPRRRPTKEEIEATLGRALNETIGEMPSPKIPGDGNHLNRIADDLAARKQRNETRTQDATTDAKEQSP